MFKHNFQVFKETLFPSLTSSAPLFFRTTSYGLSVAILDVSDNLSKVSERNELRVSFGETPGTLAVPFRDVNTNTRMDG